MKISYLNGTSPNCDENYGDIYFIINSLNSKGYIGLAKKGTPFRIEQHLKNLKKGIDYHLYRAIRKYGLDKFSVAVIDQVPIEKLNQREIDLILEYDTFHNGYNMTKGGEGRLGYKHSNDSKQKMSSAQKKRWEDLNEKQKQSESQRKRFEDPNEKQKLRDAQKIIWEDPNARQKQRERAIKQFEDPNARQKQRDATIKQWEDPNARNKASESRKGKRMVNNGIVNTWAYPNEIPEGFVLGSLKKK
jgi:group I intron endonuclease